MMVAQWALVTRDLDSVSGVLCRGADSSSTCVQGLGQRS